MSSRLTAAFAQFGAKPANSLRGRSAIAHDGALVLSCLIPQFRRQGPGVLRYEDSLSRESGELAVTTLLGEHLILARERQLPVRMVVIAERSTGRTRHNIYARPDVVGRLIEFDGNHFVVDFRRSTTESKEPERRRSRRG